MSVHKTLEFIYILYKIVETKRMVENNHEQKDYISFNNLQFGAWRTMIKNVILFYVIFNIYIIKMALYAGYRLKKALNKIIF